MIKGSHCWIHGGRWRAWWTRASARPSDYPTSAWNRRQKSSTPRGSSLPLFTSSHIRITRNGTFWTIAERMASCCKRSRRWAQSRAQVGGRSCHHRDRPARQQDTRASLARVGHPARDGALTTSKTPSRIKENFEVSTLTEDAIREISEGITSRVRFNAVVETGVPGFIPRAKGV